MTSAAGGSSAAIGTLLAAVALGQIVGAALAGLVTDAVSWRAMFLLDAALAAALILPLWRFRNSVEDLLILVGACLMGGGYLFALALGTWQAAIPAVLALGAGFALCHTTLQTRATELDPAARGTAISLSAFALFLGSAVGTAVLARLLASSGYDAVLLVSGVALLLLALAAPRLTAPPPVLEAAP